MSNDQQVLDPNTLTVIANGVKEGLMQALVGEGIMSREEALYVASNYTVVITKKGWLGQLFDRVRGVRDGEISINIMRGCTLDSLDEADEDDIDIDESQFN